MKSDRKLQLVSIAIWVVFLMLGGIAAVWAAETEPASKAAEASSVSQVIQYIKANFSRATWDLVMRWVNFLILIRVYMGHEDLNSLQKLYNAKKAK